MQVITILFKFCLKFIWILFDFFLNEKLFEMKINLFTNFSIFTDILEMLDKSKYSRFNIDPQAKDLNEFNPATDLNDLRLLVDYKYCLTYKDYKEVISIHFATLNAQFNFNLMIWCIFVYFCLFSSIFVYILSDFVMFSTKGLRERIATRMKSTIFRNMAN